LIKPRHFLCDLERPVGPSLGGGVAVSDGGKAEAFGRVRAKGNGGKHPASRIEVVKLEIVGDGANGLPYGQIFRRCLIQWRKFKLYRNAGGGFC
jgi:hypothetical protein